MKTLKYYEKSEYNNPKSLYAVPVNERKYRFFQLLEESKNNGGSTKRREEIFEKMRGVSR
jgi:hypothetical protein|nr:hypothetical protein [uncultured Lachnoclostridium sp.]